MRLVIAVVAALTIVTGAAHAADAPGAMPQMAGWFEQTIGQLEAEAASDVSMAPDVWSALARDWRSFDRDGSAAGMIVDVGWVAVATIVALLGERMVTGIASRRARRRIQARTDGPRLVDLLGLVAADLAGLTAFYVVFGAAQRHFLPAVGVTAILAFLCANVLIPWRGVARGHPRSLRPHHPRAPPLHTPPPPTH